MDRKDSNDKAKMKDEVQTKIPINHKVTDVDDIEGTKKDNISEESKNNTEAQQNSKHQGIYWI